LPTAAISSYGCSLRIGDGIPLATLSITNATNATPIVVTTSVNHSIADVGVVSVSGVVGTTAANNTPANPVWIAARVSATELQLRGSVGNGGYGGGGSLVRTQSFATIAEVTQMQDAGIATTLVDCSALDGAGYASQIPTTMMANAITLTLNLVPNNPSHDESTGLLSLAITKARKHFLLVLPDVAHTAWLFLGYVTEHKTTPSTPAGVLGATTIISMTDAPLLSMAA
jgi:hypothetical protein